VIILHEGEYIMARESGESNDGIIFIITKTDCDPVCPFCQKRLTAHDWNHRTEHCLDGTTNKYMVEDRYCESCKKMQRLLPDTIVPHKHYSAEAIERMIFDDADNILNEYPDTANEFTINRFKAWWDAMKPYFLAVILSLREKLGATLHDNKDNVAEPTFREMVRQTANSCYWTFPTHLVLKSG